MSGLLGQFAARDGEGGVHLVAGAGGATLDLRGGQAERSELLHSADPVGGVDPFAVVVLGHLVDDPVNVPGAADDGGGDAGASGLGGCEDASLAVEDDEAALLVAVTDYGHKHTALTDTGHEAGGEAGLGSHVDADDGLRWVDVLDLGSAGAVLDDSGGGGCGVHGCS